MMSGFDEWAAAAGYEVFREPGATIVASAGGEIRYTATREGDVITLFRSERAEDDAPVMRSTDPLDIDRYLTAQLGVAVRSRRGLPRLSFPFEPGDTAPGLRFEELPDGWSTLVREGGTRIAAQFRDTSMHPAVRFSLYADADVAEVRRSFADPSGAPLFAAQPDGARPTNRYFVRQHVQEGKLVPFALLRRTRRDGRQVDEVLRDVGQWAPDRNGSVDKAIRMPLETDLEEVSPTQAQEVERMVAERSYRPLSRD